MSAWMPGKGFVAEPGLVSTAPGSEEEAFTKALKSSDLVLVTAALAGRLPADRLAGAQAGHKPLVLVLEDVRGLRQPPDIAATLRRQLGMAE